MKDDYLTIQDFKTNKQKKNIRELGSDGFKMYEGWNFNSGNYLFTTDTK